MSSPTLLTGPSFSALRYRALSRAVRDASDQPGSVLLFEMNESQVDAWVQRWREDLDRSSLQLQTRGLASFVTRAHDRLLDPAPEVGTLERQRLIEQALAETESLDDGRRYVSAFSTLFREIEAHNIFESADATATITSTDLDPDIADTVLTVYGTYRRLRADLAHPHARTRSDKFRAVAETDGSLAETFSHVDHVIVSNPVDLSPIQVAVLERIATEFPITFVLPSLPGRPTPRTTGTDEALSTTLDALQQITMQTEFVPQSTESSALKAASRLYTPAVTDDPIDSSDALSWHEAPTPDREVRHIARRLRHQLATTDTEPEDILVFAPGILSYRDRIEDVFTEFGVPHVSSVSILLERTFAGRAVLDALGLCINPTIGQLERLSSNPVASHPAFEETALTDLADRVPSHTVELLLDHADDPLRSDLEMLLGQVPPVRATSGVELLDAFGRLLDRLAIKANVDRLDAVTPDPSNRIDTPAEDGPSIITGYEEGAIRRVDQILHSLTPVLARGVDDPLAELEHALGGVRVSAPKQPTADRVRIVGLKDTPMAPCSELYILGATREHLGGAADRPRYFRRIADALGLPGADRERVLARYRFGLLLANAENVHVTTPAETMGGEDVLPSPMLKELASVADIERTSGVEQERRGSKEDVQRALAGSPPAELDDPLRALQAEGTYSDSQATAMRSGAHMCASRASPNLSAFDAQLDADTLETLHQDLQRSPYSPSRLNTYAKCGFKYYLDKGLDLAVPDDISLDAGRFAVGDVVHQALEHFYQGLLDDAGPPVDIDAYSRDELERRLLDAADRARGDVEDGFDSPFDRQTLVALYAGLATAETNDFHGVAIGSDELGGRGLFVQILDRELGTTDGKPLDVEAWFGTEESPVVLDDVELPLHGLIDRVDIVEGDDGAYSARVIDYKTYNRDATPAVRGLDFQLPAYALGARQLVEEKIGTRPVDIDAEFRVFNLPTTVRHPQSLGGRVARDLETDSAAFLTTVIPSWVEQLTDGIESGAFQPTFIGAEAAGCRNCDYAAVCDVRHHRRFEVIAALDDGDHPAFVPPGSRPGELVEHMRLPVQGDDGQ